MATKKISIDPNTTLVIEKKTSFEFIVTELAIYLSQTFMFFVVAALTSNMLRDEASLTNYMNSKINDHSLEEVGYIIVATILTIGILSALARAIKPIGWLEALSDEVLNEIPRAIYFFGSSVTGAIIAAAIFVHNHPVVKAPAVGYWLFMAAVFGFGAFIYGCGMSYAFKQKTHVKHQ